MKKFLFTLFLLTLTGLIYGQVTNGLVGHFPFVNGSYTDMAEYQDCVLSSNGDRIFYLAEGRFGNPDYAIDFQGAVLNAGINSRDVTTEVTVSLWMKTTVDSENVQFLVHKYYCVEPPLGYHMALQGDSVTFDGRDNSSNEYMRSGWSETDVNDGEWHHIVGLARSEGIWEIWVDANKESSKSYSPIQELNHYFCNLEIAGGIHNQTNWIYKGVLDDIRFYNRALDSLEIDSLFNELNPTSGFYEPSGLSLINNISPNPFTTSTTIEYELKQPEKVSLTIYNHLGQLVYKAQENQTQGKQQLQWKAESYADGIYYFRLQAGDAVANGKMVKIK